VSLKPHCSGLLLLLSIGSLLSCGDSNGPESHAKPRTEILYILENGSVTTYSIDPASLAATPAEQPVALTAPQATLVQFDPSPHDNFLYAVWSDAQSVQHLSVYGTDDSGVPQLPPTQTLDADSLSQFNMHPGGKFAYMLQVTSSNNQFTANIRLFRVQASDGELDGKLKETTGLQGAYGPSPYWPAILYGFSPDNRKLYINSQATTGSVFLQRTIDPDNGTLGASKQLLTLDGDQDVTIGTVIAVLHRSSATPNDGYLDVFPNIPNPKRAVHCTASMLPSCGSASYIKLDRSGRYVFLTDSLGGATHIARINVAKHKITDTGNLLPMTSQTPGFVFNHDGSIVYVMQTDGSLHFYHFDSSSGSLTEGGTPLPLAQGSGICPALRR
jgi:6-phosphogluconolactonase (cycloisomerase 2 family)